MSSGADRAVTPTAQQQEEGTNPGGEAPESTRDVSSIDKLLALTDSGWELEDQIKTLKQAAVQKPLADQSAAQRAMKRAPALHMPTPFELAPTQVAAGPAVIEKESPSAPGSSPSKPPPLPPLPPRASKRPPPLPRSVPPPLGAAGAGPFSARVVRDVTPEPSRVTPVSSPSGSGSHLADPSVLVDLLVARLSTLESKDDKVGVARAHIELAIASETILGDEARATQHAEAALRTDPHLPAAHALLRRRKHARAALPQLLEHLREELAAASAEPAIVELLAEKARLLEALSDRGEDVRATWEQALAKAPGHAAALKGLEAELWARAQSGSADANEALANHLARMADAYSQEPGLAAWLYVERASLLERKLHRPDAARAALERALELESATGPVRDALVRHAARHSDWSKLAALLAEEAQIESLDARCTQLELDAAAIYASRLKDEARAVKLLESAAERAPTEAIVDRMVLDLLVQLHEAELRPVEAAKARRARLAFVNEPSQLAHELKSLAAIEEKLGQIDAAIEDVQRALAIDASDPTVVETLDRLLATTNRHEQRVAMWLTEAARCS
jgi:hypothetical protein